MNSLGCLGKGVLSKWTGQQLRKISNRAYSRSNVRLGKAAEVTANPPPSAGGSAAPPLTPNPAIIGGTRMSPTALDKMFLVWSGLFKSKAEIPSILAGDTVFKARSFARIRINIGFLFLAGILSGVMIYSGKQAAKRGESIEKSNLDWHRQVNEEYKKELAANNAK